MAQSRSKKERRDEFRRPSKITLVPEREGDRADPFSPVMDKADFDAMERHIEKERAKKKKKK